MTADVGWMGQEGRRPLVKAAGGGGGGTRRSGTGAEEVMVVVRPARGCSCRGAPCSRPIERPCGAAEGKGTRKTTKEND